MSHVMRSSGRECLIGGSSRLSMLLFVLTVTAPAIAGVPVPGPDSDPSHNGSSAEVRFPAPVRHAIVRQPPGPTQGLYGAGAVIVHPQAPERALTVMRVEASHLLVRVGAGGPSQALRPGDPLPGCPGCLFTGTVLIDTVHYRYRRVERIAHVDPVLVALEGARATVEIEVPHLAGSAPAVAAAGTAPRPPVRSTLQGTLLGRVQVRALGLDQYEVGAPEVQAALENAGRVLAELAPGVVPTYSTADGVAYRLTSPAGDGLLGRHGFTVRAPKLAARAGIEVGDTILSVNGVAVDGFASLFRIYQQVRRSPALGTIQVDLDRGGTRVTKTYRLR